MRHTRRRRIGWALGGLVAMLIAALLAVATQRGSDEGAAHPTTPPTRLEQKAVGVERRLHRHPRDADLLRATTLAWIEAGNQRLDKLGSVTEPIPAAIKEDFEAGFRAWSRYLSREGGNAGGDLAELVGGAHFHLLELGSRDLAEIEANAAAAAHALDIAGRKKPILYTLSNTATYDYFDGRFAAGDRAAKGAAEDVAHRRWIVWEELHTYRQRAEYFRGQLRRAARELQETGDTLLQKPLRLYYSSTEINKDDPTVG